MDGYYIDRSRRDGHQYSCKECVRETQKERRANNPEYLTAYHVRRKYNLTLQEYNALMERPCAICNEESHHLDHDHTSNLVRQALCRTCNLMLGLAHDDPARLRAAADYLEEHA